MRKQTVKPIKPESLTPARIYATPFRSFQTIGEPKGKKVDAIVKKKIQILRKPKCTDFRTTILVKIKG